MTPLLHRPELPRTNRYESEWVIDGSLGPHPLWLAEWLITALKLQPGMLVLDLGCGKALTSVFLAREFDVHAYQYFGTDLLYLHYLSRFLRPGGMLGVAMPGLVRPFPDGRVPAHLAEPQSNGKVFWEDECVSFQTVDWWRALFRQCSRVELTHADTLADGWRLWADFERAVEQSGRGLFPADAEALEKDAGRHLGFVRVVARRGEAMGSNLYEPALLTKVEGDNSR